jgi:hypothetical protein
MTSGRVLRAGRCGIRGHGKAHFLAEGAGYVRCPKPRRAGCRTGLGPGCRGDGQPVAVSPAMAAGREAKAGRSGPLGVPVTTDPSAPLRRPVSWTRPPRPSSPFISGGQPVIFVRNGRPVAVVMDVDSYEEAEVASRQAPEHGSIHAVSRHAGVPWFMSGSSGWRHHDEDARVTGREGGR